MTSKEIKFALKEARTALDEAGLPHTKSNILKVLVDYYGFEPRFIEDLKL